MRMFALIINERKKKMVLTQGQIVRHEQGEPSLFDRNV